MLDALLDRLANHDRLALARLITLASHGDQVGKIVAGLPTGRAARVVAVTGSAGVGKSTLVGKLIEAVRRQGLSVAVLACDPQSPLSGGALLGDRFRMPSRPDDDGVFIRSLAAPGGRGAVVEHVEALVRILESFGFDVVIIETVGAGQGDTVVGGVADVVVLLLQPETGDDLQWEKAGVLEVADVVAVHKADLPGADRVEAQVRSATDLSTGRRPQIVRVSSKTGEGIDALWDAIAGLPLRRHAGSLSDGDLLRVAQDQLAERFTAAASAGDARLRDLLTAWRGGTIDAEEAAERLLALLAPAEPAKN